MPSPTFTFRLPAKDKESLLEMSRIYGAPSPGAFCAEMIGAICSGDMERVKAFNTRLIAKVGEQLTLKLNAVLDSTETQKKPLKRAKKGKTTPKGRKRA